MKKYLGMLSAAVVIGTLRVNVWFDCEGIMLLSLWMWLTPLIAVNNLKFWFFVVVALLFYVQGKYLRSWRDGQLT